MKKIFVKILLLVLIFFYVLNNLYSQSGWLQYNAPTIYGLNSIFFPPTATGFTGYVCGNMGVICKTTDGADNWVIQTGPGYDLHSIFFTDVITGYAVGEHGTIMKTTNGGTNWSSLNSGITDPIYSVVFVNSNTGYTAGIGNDRILKTTNAGSSWTIQTPGSMFGQFAISFADENTGCTVGLNASINRTTNGGLNWVLIQSGSSDDLLLDVFFKNNFLAFAVGDNGLILKSTNAGISWSDISFGNDLLHSVNFITDDIGYITGASAFGLILKTTDGGNSWNQQSSGTLSSLFKSSFTDLNIGYICGSQGTVLKTTTGGVMTGFSNNIAQLPENFSLMQNYPNPFNPSTFIKYQCSKSGHITLKLTDNLGKEMAVLVDKEQPAGYYSIQLDGRNYPSGVYFCLLYVNGKLTDSKAMTIVK